MKYLKLFEEVNIEMAKKYPHLFNLFIQDTSLIPKYYYQVVDDILSTEKKAYIKPIYLDDAIIDIKDRKNNKIREEGNIIYYEDETYHFYWGAKDEDEYQGVEEEIEDLNSSGNGWAIIASYDLSGYEYWMERQREQNYINMSIEIDLNVVRSEDMAILNRTYKKALREASDIVELYDYDPNKED